MTTCSRRMFLLGTATTFAGAYLAACGKEPSAEIAATEIPVGSAVIVDKVIFAQPIEGGSRPTRKPAHTSIRSSPRLKA